MTTYNDENTGKLKIFVGYHKPNVIYSSNVFQPILTADVDWDEKNVIKDNTGINIASRNKHYGELSGHYWVWKNFMPKTNAEYIGFCHYRRFLDYDFFINEKIAFRPTYETDFKKMFPKYTEKNILKKIKNYDIILPHKYFIIQGLSVYEQCSIFHPKKDIDWALYLIQEFYPEYFDAATRFMNHNEMYTCLHFIMKKELVNDYMEWMFNILTALEQKSDWSKYKSYMSIRMPAYIAERFFNIWLMHNIETKKLKVLNTSSLLLIGKNYEGIDSKNYIKSYNEQKEILRRRKLNKK